MPTTKVERVPGREAMGRSGSLTHRSGPVSKRRLGEDGAALLGVIVDVLDLSSRMGVTRDHVADRLGVSRKTLDSWLQAERDALMPFDALVGLLTGALDPFAADELWRELGRRGGRTVVRDELVEPDSATLGVQVLGVAAAVGAVCERVADAEADGRIDEHEAAALRPAVRALMERATELMLRVSENTGRSRT